MDTTKIVYDFATPQANKKNSRVHKNIFILLTIGNATFVSSIPIRIVEQHGTIVGIGRVCSSALLVQEPTEELLAASIQSTRQPLSRVDLHVVRMSSIVPRV